MNSTDFLLVDLQRSIEKLEMRINDIKNPPTIYSHSYPLRDPTPIYSNGSGAQNFPIEEKINVIKELIHSLGNNDKLISEVRNNIALLKRGTLAYELIPPIAPPAKTVPQSILGNRYIIGNPKHYVVIDNTGQVWQLGKSQAVYGTSWDGGYYQYIGDEPKCHGERHKYPLPTILQSVVSNILSYVPANNRWAPGGDTIDPSVYSMSHLQPVAKYLFDNYAPITIKQEYLDISSIEDKVEAQLHHVKKDDFPTIYINLRAKHKAIEKKREDTIDNYVPISYFQACKSPSSIKDKVEAQLHHVKKYDFPTFYKNLCTKQKAIELKRQEWYTQK